MLTLTLQRKTTGVGVDIVNVAPKPVWVHRYWEKGHYRYRIILLDSPGGPADETAFDTVSRRRIREVWEETYRLGDAWRRERFGR